MSQGELISRDNETETLFCRDTLKYGIFCRKLLKYALRAEKMAESVLRADSTLYLTLQITRWQLSYIRICPIVCNDLLVDGGRKSLLSVSTLQSDQLTLSYFRTNEHNSSL